MAAVIDVIAAKDCLCSAVLHTTHTITRELNDSVDSTGGGPVFCLIATFYSYKLGLSFPPQLNDQDDYVIRRGKAWW